MMKNKNSLYFCGDKRKIVMEKRDPIDEARRYVENAKNLLAEHGDYDAETQSYMDRKYVKMAGNTLWNGVLLILDAVFHVKKNKRSRPDITDYQQAVAARDKKLLTWVNNGYNILHLYMGYDGVRDKATCMSGIRTANEIIDKCAMMLPSEGPSA